MKRFGRVLQWLGVIFIALFPFYYSDESYTNYIPILLISGVTLGLLGSLLVKTSKIGIIALCLTLLAVITYFYIEQRLIYKALIISSLVLVVVKQILIFKEQQLQKASNEGNS
ncbi:hypothetical protein IMZ08_17385 [Bacillus luteolus]|uniref:Uncharacterized protein n=1 Tax=Litchfieldia luteola TaxID=682179 RepID=A0ABR9QMS6_9BACI|nr:hypothetical protein [Cytobacillus luteolus]MBE4909810.1 hypothetical protein [Cytobacillus luteolus]MBP1942641.1 phosphoglycerol transferase MdoB-like AlkP superfamily enzyme [Cytobacillus luteolus]